mmetsp:Transcript_58200/g.189696  ORF Transcript_58200/g.189696 Transcript_58200/m.189696 type:complete len:203 (-) Transcript_58200:17-625(-)
MWRALFSPSTLTATAQSLWRTYSQSAGGVPSATCCRRSPAACPCQSRAHVSSSASSTRSWTRSRPSRRSSDCSRSGRRRTPCTPFAVRGGTRWRTCRRSPAPGRGERTRSASSANASCACPGRSRGDTPSTPVPARGCRRRLLRPPVCLLQAPWAGRRGRSPGAPRTSPGERARPPAERHRALLKTALLVGASENSAARPRE